MGCLVATIAFVLAVRNCDVPYAEVAMIKSIVDWTAYIIVVLFAVVIGLVKAIIETVNAPELSTATSTPRRVPGSGTPRTACPTPNAESSTRTTLVMEYLHNLFHYLFFIRTQFF